ncbi:MAG: hypothetical protein NTW21_14530 [Verrucomicrobia bacterium]|nr:hypothetical protein [Verrucomicrobiota bacterium]
MKDSIIKGTRRFMGGIAPHVIQQRDESLKSCGAAEDGGHGMTFRDCSGPHFLVLHQPNGGPERTHFFRLKADDD